MNEASYYVSPYNDDVMKICRSETTILTTQCTITYMAKLYTYYTVCINDLVFTMFNNHDAVKMM